MNLVKNHLYIDSRTKVIMVFDSTIIPKDSEYGSIVYIFTDIESYFSRLYFGDEINYVKEY